MDCCQSGNAAEMEESLNTGEDDTDGKSLTKKYCQIIHLNSNCKHNSTSVKILMRNASFFIGYIEQKLKSVCVRHPGSPLYSPPLERRSIISLVMRSESGSLLIHLVLSSGQE